MLIGLTLVAVAIFLVAQSTIFGFKPTSVMIIMGLLLLGGASPMISIPIMPEMLESIETRPDLNFDPDIVNNYSSSMFVTATGLGEAIGPILNSVLIDSYGFTRAHEIYGSIMLFTGLLYFLTCGNFTICKFEYSVPEEKDYSEMTSQLS